MFVAFYAIICLQYFDATTTQNLRVMCQKLNGHFYNYDSMRKCVNEIARNNTKNTQHQIRTHNNTTTFFFFSESLKIRSICSRIKGLDDEILSCISLFSSLFFFFFFLVDVNLLVWSVEIGE